MNPAAPLPSRFRAEISRLTQDAENAWADQDYYGAIALLEQASRLDPNDLSLLTQIARAHGLRYDYAAAEARIEQAVRASPRPAHALTEAAKACLEFDRVDLATRYLERAAREADVTIGALVTLADIHLRERHTDHAAEAIAHAARIDPCDPRIRLLDARLRRARGDADGAESLLHDLRSSAAAGPAVRVRALYELAGLLDATERFDEAMSALLQAKNLQRPDAAPCLPAAALADRRAREMEATITEQVLDRWRAAGAGGDLAPTRRIALLCGHPRSGTTLLEQVLDAHPGITTAEETRLMHDEAYLPLIRDTPEGTSILDALDAATPTLLRHARDNYFRSVDRQTGRAVGDRLLIDKNPALNLLIPMVVRVFPEAKFLVALRDPRDVVLSCFMQALPMTPVSAAYLSLETAALQYASVMNFWIRMRPRLAGRYLEVRYEDTVHDLEATSRRVLGFLGLDFHPAVLRYYEHAAAKRIGSPSHQDVRKPIYRTALGRWESYRAHLEPHLPRLEPFLRAFGYAS